jgi:hypothetical protein
VANIVVDSPTGRGVLYFVTCFFAAISMWRDKVYYDSRYVIDDDLYHRFFETMLFVGVAFGFVHINPVSIMSNPREHPDMFAFALVATFFTILNFLGYMEIYFYGVGQRSVLKDAALRDIRLRTVPFGLQLAATIVAGVEYFVNGAGAQGGNGYTDQSFEEGYSAGQTYTNDIPIWLLLGSQLIQNLAMVITIQFLFPKDGSHKNHAVPINITFLVHRDGEWIMLMLGER